MPLKRAEPCGYIKEGLSRAGDSLQGRDKVGVLGTDPWDLSLEGGQNTGFLLHLFLFSMLSTKPERLGFPMWQGSSIS